jgi:hypothetical protein
MESSAVVSRFRSLRLLQFRFRHRTDWTRHTRNLRCTYLSLGWYPCKAEFNFEVGLLKWRERRVDPLEFFGKMIQRHEIYSLEHLEPVAGNTYLVGFTGPYSDTVREKILEYNVGLYSSNVHGGAQEWRIIIDRAFEQGFLNSVGQLGNVIQLVSRTPTPREVYGFIHCNALALRPIMFLLSPREYHYLLEAKRLGYFEKRRSVRLEDVAQTLSRNPSTVNRGLRSGVNKIVNYLITATNVA